MRQAGECAKEKPKSRREASTGAAASAMFNDSLVTHQSESFLGVDETATEKEKEGGK